MRIILFNDHMSLKTVKDGKIKEYTCDFYNNYVTAERRTKDNYAWKYHGAGARFMGEERLDDDDSDGHSYFNSLDFLNEDEIIYSVTVKDISGVMRKYLSDDKLGEAHVIHSRDLVFDGACPNSDKTKFITCVKSDFVTAHLTEYDFKTDDYYTLTDGDCADLDAVYSRRNSDEILFSTKGAGRNAQGEFVKYSPAKICSYNKFTGDITEIFADANYSFVKPKDDENGNLYYIRRPEEKPKASPLRILLDVILIPWRLLQAVYYFLESFTISFTGKKFIRDGSNPAKTRDRNKRQTMIEGNLINAENEYKNNLRHKDANAGYAPRSWELIRRSPDGSEKVVRRGVIDYCLARDEEIVLTNGKYVLCIDKDGKEHKITETSLCTKVAAFDN